MSDIAKAQEELQASPRPNRDRLYEIASEQGGYFTSTQAREAGFSWSLLSHHVKHGRFLRARHGLYRLREYPSSRREQVLAAWLAVGKDIALVSHESALDLLGLSDVVPDAVHISVPRSRRNLPPRPGVRIHTTTQPIPQADRAARDGIAITAAGRSILDAAETGMAPEQVQAAVMQAVERGLATSQQLARGATARGQRVAKLIEVAVRQASVH